MKRLITILFLIISFAAFSQNRGRQEHTYLNLDSVKVAGTVINATKIAAWDAGGGITTIAAATDVSISSPSNLQFLQYQTGNGKWNNHTLASSDIPDLSATYQTIANLTTNTSLGSSNTLYPSQLAVKTYVDNTAATITPKAASDYATTTALGANTYANGTLGVGATITITATGTVTIDGHVTALNENILIKDEGTQSHNGIYTVTTAGAIGVQAVFTRRTDFDQAAEIVKGAETFVVNGTANAGKKFTQNSAVTTVGTDAITFVQTGGASGVAWGAITGTLSSQTDLQSALNLKANLASPTFTGTVTIPTSFVVGATTVTTTGTQLNYMNAATGTTGTTSTNIVFSTSPTLVTPALGVATATSINKITLTTPLTGATLTIDDGFTLHATGNVTALSGSHTGTSSGTNTGDQTSVSGNAGTATALETARTINGTLFDGTANITVTAAAGSLTGSVLASGVTSSSLTSFGNSPVIVTPSITTGFTIGGVAASGKIIIGNGTNFVASTPTYPNAASTSGKVLQSDGTNLVMSTPTFPTTAGTSGKILISDGTNIISSTPTYPNSAGTSGNVLQSDGTNIVSSTNTGGWTEFHVSGSNATTTGQTLVDVTGLVTGTLTNSTKYEIEAVLNVSTSNVTTGTEYGIGTGGSGGASVVNAIIHGTTTAAAATEQTINTSSTATTAYLTASSINGTVWIRGFVTTRGSGTANISIQHLKVTSGTSTVFIGSVFRYRLAQ